MSVAVTFCLEVEYSTYIFDGNYPMDYGCGCWVCRVFVYDDVAVGVIGVKVFWFYSLYDYDIAYMQCLGKWMTPAVAKSIVWDTHASAFNDSNWDVSA